MLSDINQTLRQMIFERARLDPSEVEIQFDAPAKEWINSRTKPTISFFLYDLEENTELRQSAMEAVQVRGANGNTISVKRPAPRRFNLNYMVSAISTVIEDEHHLLWRVMSALLRTPVIPEEFISENVKRLEIPLRGRVSQPDDGPRPIDLWNSLETAPRPSLLYVLTVPVDLETEFTAPLVLTRTLRYNTVEGVFADAFHHIGGRVVDKLGAPMQNARVMRNGTEIRTDQNGRFVIVSVPEGVMQLEVNLDGQKPRKVKLEVPSEHYDVILE